MPGERIYSFLSIPYDPCLVNLAVIIKKHFELLKGEDAISQVVSTSKSPFILFSIPTMEAIFSVLSSLGAESETYLLYLRARCKGVCVI